MDLDAPTRLSCPACQKYFKVKRFNPSSRVSCPQCKGPLVEPVGPTPKADLLGDTKPAGGWEIPVRLGRYSIAGEIARGGMGVVYRAEQEDLHRPIAIKMMLPHLANDPEHVHRFMREARAAAKLKHPNIVTIHEIGDYRNVPFFTMDFVDGHGLDEIATAPMPVPKAVTLVRDVARAVHYANEQGIVHRDLKPGNILVDRKGVPRITDFGLAKDLDSRSMLSVTGEVLGTPSYMSPEQAQGFNHQIDRRTDIYSLGVVLYRILTGRVPFEGNTYADTIFKLVHNDPVDPARVDKKIPSDLGAVVLRAMEKSPGDRYRTAGEFADDLDRFLAGEPVIATRPSPLILWKRKLVKHRIAASVAGGACAVALVAVVAMFLFMGRSELDLVEENLKVPAMKMTALGTLLEGMADGRFRKEARRAHALARGVMPPQAHANVRDAVMGALERHGPKLDPFLDDGGADAVIQWIAVDPPRFIRFFALRKDRRAVDAVLPYLSPDHPKEAKLEAVRYCAAVPDAKQYYGLGRLITDRDVGSEARSAMEAQYANKVVSLFHPGANVGGAIGQLGSDVAKYNQQMQEMLDQTGPKPSGPKDPVEMAISKLSEADEKVRLQAAFELGGHKDARGREPLLKALSDTDTAVADVAALSLGDCGLGDVEPKVIALLKDSRPSVRRAAAIALGRAKASAAKGPLEEAFKVEKDERVKDALLDAMSRVR
jgi:hypothetical protein